MKGHGPFSVTLQGGGILDAPRTDDTFELNGAILIVTTKGAPRGPDQVDVLKLWQQLTVSADNVS